MNESNSEESMNKINFKAETHELLEILIHSLYSDKEVFLRELISNASDALTRVNFEMLTNRNIVDPEVELAITISTDLEQKLLVISDSGIGMTSEELVENLGTIAHSGARAFIQAAQQGAPGMYDIIGQFGVGFYSAFMVAEWIKVASRSYQPDARSAEWFSTGADTYSINPIEKPNRGTTITIKLKDEAIEFLQENRIRSIIKKYSDYIPFPIYLGPNKDQCNQQIALWRKIPRQVEEKEYNDFYRQFTMDVDEPIEHLHISVDAPVQMYAILFFPANPEQSIFSLRKHEGLRLYARKVLIQDYSLDLLPEYFRFIQGVVDSEDIPLNISRETVQSAKIIPQLRKILTNRVIETIKNLAENEKEKFKRFWEIYSRYIKEGIAIDKENSDALIPLLHFHSISTIDEWITLDDYISKMKDSQKKIYYIIGGDEKTALNSPHLEIFKKKNINVLLFTDPLDPFWVVRQSKYKDYSLVNVSTDAPSENQEPGEQLPDQGDKSSNNDKLIQLFKLVLGDRIENVRITHRLVQSPARLVDKEGELNIEMQHVYRLLNREYKQPQKILELNTDHPILKGLNQLSDEDPILNLVIEQIFEDALLAEGIQIDTTKMINRIQELLEMVIKKSNT